MIHIKSPAPTNVLETRTVIFLAGSIEMGTALDWQATVVDSFKNADVTLLNPRRDNWDSSWAQKTDNPLFVEQVTWELSAIDRSSDIIFYFQPSTVSPISLLELGLALNKRRYTGKTRVWVCCPHGYFRKGNVDITCSEHYTTVYTNLPEMLSEMKRTMGVL